VAGYSDPGSILADILGCANDYLGCPNTKTHTGTIGSGVVIDCACPEGCVLRVEDEGWYTREGMVSLNRIGGRCVPLVARVALTYLECFPTTTVKGAAVSAADLTAQGNALQDTMWGTVRQLSCCDDSRQWRFVSADSLAPEGNCAGFLIRLEADFQLCECPEVS
jgi:hypothetical protein